MMGIQQNTSDPTGLLHDSVDKRTIGSFPAANTLSNGVNSKQDLT